MTAHWKQFFAAALAETNLEHLPRRIEEARVAIMERVDELINDPDRQPEHDQILEALNRLSRLESDLRRRV